MGEWMPGMRCPFVCGDRGECGGVCVPNSKRCDGPNKLTPQSCDPSGQWVDAGPVCVNLCSSGSCGGSCMPGTKRCGSNQTPETCSVMGTWEPAPAACPFVCVGLGECGGICKPASRQCSATAVQTCSTDGSGWSDTESCRFGCDSSKTACRACSTRQGQNCLNTACQTGTYDCNDDCVKKDKQGSCGTCKVCKSGSCEADVGANCGTGAGCVDSHTYKGQDKCGSNGACVAATNQTCASVGEICTKTGCGTNDFASCNSDGDCSSNTCIPVGNCKGKTGSRCEENLTCGPTNCGGIPVCSPTETVGCSPPCVECVNKTLKCWPINGL
jgi:hypothetical protein